MNETIKKIFVFGNLYVSEGIEGAISSVILPLYLAKLGFSAGIVGLAMSITTIPWVIKIIWGLTIDEFANRGRKIFIIGGGLLGSIMNLIIFAMHPSILPIIISLIFISRVGIATLDTSTDALAISVSKKHERGKINGAEFMGQLIGYSLGAIYFTRLAVRSYSIPFLAAGVLILLFASVVFMIKDVKAKPSLKKLKDVFVNKWMLIVLISIILINLPSGLIGISAFYMKKNLQITEVLVGEIATTAGIVNAIGSLIGGSLSDKYGRTKIMFISLLLYGITIFPAYFYFVPFFIISSMFTGSITSVLCAYGMDITRKNVAATEYSVLTSTANFGYMIGISISGYLLQFFGTSLFIITAFSIIPGLFAIRKLKHVPAGI